MSIQELCSILSIVIVFISLNVGIYQWIHANKLKRAEYLNKIIEK